MAWGVYYGLLLLAEKFLLKDIKKKLPGAVNLLVTLVLVLVGWVLFYYESLGDGVHHLGIMFGFVRSNLTDPTAVYYFKHYLAFLVFAVLACVPWKAAADRLQEIPGNVAKNLGRFVKPLVITAIFLLALCMIVTQSYNPFLYFRF